ncbi:odorant receptor Or1-like [Xylocopa sonorina]|uniref:odorant receptor Or1-like n=1 Tax=Xylocopa sonorina TaxID=1818115 RepID=UPI00403AC38E
MRVSTFFTLLSCTGCWRPISWTSPLKIGIYSVYTLTVILCTIAFFVSEIGSIFTVENVDEFVDITYILITIFVGFCKLMNVLFFRREIMNLVNMFLEEPCATSSMEESEIQLRYDNRLWRNALCYGIMIEASVMMTTISSLLTNFQEGRLTYRAWIPYNYTSTIVFTLTFTFQLLPVLMQSLVHVATDVLFVGLLMQICCQFEILVSRLDDVATNSVATLRRFVRHHNCIYELAEAMNNTLNLMIFSQFFGSFLVLCLSMIQLLKADILSTEFLATILYLATILLQSFLYCWHGNEVKLKSIDLSDVIFHSNWTKLNKDSKQILLIAMNRTQSPIELETAHVITVNVDLFVVLIKTSYSVYNLLQNS